MDIGSGIAVMSGVAGTLAVVFKIIDLRNPPRNGDGVMVVKHCPEHSGVMISLLNIEKAGDRHEEWLKEISNDIKILVKGSASDRLRNPTYTLTKDES